MLARQTALNVKAPALSTSLLGLSRELNADLFLRGQSGLDLTDAGWALLDPARNALHGADRARFAVAEASGVLRGSLRIASVALPQDLEVMHSVRRFQDDHPDVDVQVIREGARQVLELVTDGQADFGITPLTRRSLQILRFEPLASAPLVLFCPPGHRLIRAQAINAAELVDEPIIDLPRGWWARDQFDRMFRTENVYRRVRLEINEWLSILSMVQAGMGLAYGPATMVNNELFPNIEIARPVSPPSWELGTVTRSGSLRPAVVVALLTAYRDQCRGGEPSKSMSTPTSSAHSMTFPRIA